MSLDEGADILAVWRVAAAVGAGERLGCGVRPC